MSQFAEKLEAATETLLAEVSSLPHEVIAWKPADDIWSGLEILGHVAEFIPYWTGQILQIVTDPTQEWGRTHADTARIEAVNRASSRTVADLSDDIRARVQTSSATLREMTDAQLAVEAPSRNPRWGVKPASFIADELLVGHVEKHARQLHRNATQFQQKPPA
jgi:uncharacterized damage-inducible protein DinB